MKTFIVFFIFLVGSLSASVEMERIKCNEIKCDGLSPEEHYRCRNQEKRCHRRVFNMQIELWEKEGINNRTKRDVLRSLEQSLESNRNVTQRLKDEVEVLENERLEIQEQIQRLRSL